MRALRGHHEAQPLQLHHAAWHRHTTAATGSACFCNCLQVLDVGQVVAGNFCGGLLAYFGADVIKV